jgi:cellulose synthase/poly-beta-1,6-N-acetylglucosamine synthase-like glycosyltransferase
MLSFIIPAHNEETELPATLDAIHAAAAALNREYEVIVANDASTDRTHEVAAGRGAMVVTTDARHIAAARNVGWRASKGHTLIFVDADTRITPSAVREAIEAMEKGAVGGGSPITFEGPVPFYARAALPPLLLLFRVFRYTGGCFFFSRRDALEKVGGWSERVYASEEIELANALKAEFGRGRFVIIRSSVATSGRKLRTFSARELFGPLLRVLLHGRRVVESREHLDVWYGQRRPDPDHRPAKPETGITPETPR